MPSNTSKPDVLASLSAIAMLGFVACLFGIAFVSRNLLAALAAAGGWACSLVARLLERRR